MARPAQRYDIYLPITDNSGIPFPEEFFTSVESLLISRFGGVTSQERRFPLRGLWRDAERVFSDQVIVMTILSFARAGNARFIQKLKRDLLDKFKQLEILITEYPLKVH